MATNWTFESTVSSNAVSAASIVTTGTVTPNVDDLMVVFAGNIAGTTLNTTFTITDSSVLGATWEPVNPTFYPNGFTSGLRNLQGWWKVANTTDHNSGLGITVTATASGGTGTQATNIECDIYRVGAGHETITVDYFGVNGAATNAKTFTLSGLSENYPNFTDLLAVSALYTPSGTNGGIDAVSGTNEFVGATTANLGLALTSGNTLLACQYVGGVQGTGSGNSIKNTWTDNRAWIGWGGYFVYTGTTFGILPVLLNDL